ncbi:helix-turn-helix domain-containing protein [Actinomadura atramentaria]|uniref:helix-turn-helix domain-containing protein n=1 Tax=Actinomadura atramentaria TaxID=1990 RepID=UPI0003631E72|nr:helix-turn-helix domain-containing protein [Actinomadura atramentaria]
MEINLTPHPQGGRELLPEERRAEAARALSAAAAVRAVTRPAEQSAVARVRQRALEALAVGLTWRRTAELAQVKLRTLQRWAAEDDAEDGTEAGADERVPLSIEDLMFEHGLQLRAFVVPGFGGAVHEDESVEPPERDRFVATLETAPGDGDGVVVAEGDGATLAEALTTLRLHSDAADVVQGEPPF